MKISSRIAVGLALGAMIFATGCTDTVAEEKNSPELSEKAEVVDLVFTPSNHGSNVNPSIHMTGNGDVGVSLTFTEVDIPEKYAVVFHCQHGKFIIDGDQAKAKEMWNRLKMNQAVTVRYQEVYEEDYLITETWWGKETNRTLTGRKLLKYHFIDAS